MSTPTRNLFPPGLLICTDIFSLLFCNYTPSAIWDPASPVGRQKSFNFTYYFICRCVLLHIEKEDVCNWKERKDRRVRRLNIQRWQSDPLVREFNTWLSSRFAVGVTFVYKEFFTKLAIIHAKDFFFCQSFFRSSQIPGGKNCVFASFLLTVKCFLFIFYRFIGLFSFQSMTFKKKKKIQLSFTLPISIVNCLLSFFLCFFVL